jgi:glycosyltransferase involved in cell wall biosynthesis
MNILLITELLYPSQIGGPSNTIYWHAKALVSQNIDVSTIATAQGVEEKHNILIDKWISTNYGEVIYCKSRLGAFYQALKNYNKYDIVHLSSLFYYPSILIAVYSFLKGRSFVWSPRGECSPEALKFSSWKKRPALKIIKFISKSIFFHSTSAKETTEIRHIFGNVKIVEIPNYLYLENKLETPVKQQLLFMGRIHPIKALENLINAFAVSNQLLLHNFDLQIIGGSKGQEEYYENLKNLIIELKLTARVKLIDHIDGTAKTTKLAESYCLILPSHTENFGNVVIEALNQGTPVIASKNTPWQLLDVDAAGMHVSNHPEELARAINAMIAQSDESYRQMRINAYNVCKDQFSITNNIYKWIKTYKSMSTKINI